MFLCCLDSTARQQRSLNNEIEKQLKKGKQDGRNEYKVLLLGTGESGKTTFLKQMRIISNTVFTDKERYEIKGIIMENIIDSIRKLLQEYNKRAGVFNHPIGDVVKVNYDLKMDHFKCMNSFWKESVIQQIFNERGKFHILDSFQYFMDNLQRILKKDYIPTDQDILHARKATTGVQEQRFKIGDATFRLMDVGGQRGERKNWIHCFTAVTSIIFLAAISEYDQKLAEFEAKNRMLESIALFNTIFCYKIFDEKSMILFLNKCDILEIKLKLSPITVVFSDFKGDEHSISDAKNYILEKYMCLAKQMDKTVFSHFTSVTDTESTKVVFESVKFTILQQNLMSYYFV